MRAKRFWRPNDRLADVVLDAFLARMEWPCSIPDEAKGAWAQLALLGLEGVGVESLQELRLLGRKARTAVFNPAFTSPLARSIDAGVAYLESLGWLEGTEDENTVSLVHSVAGALSELPESDFNQLRSFCI